MDLSAPFCFNFRGKMASKRKEDIVVDKDFNYLTVDFKTMDDYDKYNNWARKNSRPVKVPTEDFYKKVRVKFQRFDQPENVLKARLRNREIDWRGQLKPGRIYDLAPPVIKFLNSLATPIFEDGIIEPGNDKKEPIKVGERCRFSCQVLDFL